jgi:hypothetical protein
LDRARDQAITGLQVSQTQDTVELTLSGSGLAITAAELERKSRLFSRVFDVDVAVREAAAL